METLPDNIIADTGKAERTIAINSNASSVITLPETDADEAHTKAWRAVQDAQAQGDFDRFCTIVIHQARHAGQGADCKAFWRACEQEARAARELYRKYPDCPRPWLLGRLEAAGLMEWSDALRGVKAWTSFVY